MKWFRSALLQLDSISPNTALKAVKQAIRPNTQFFDSLSLQPPNLIDELLQRGNQYAMLEDDVIATTKRTVANTSESRSCSRGKGKRSRNEQDDSEQDEMSKSKAGSLDLSVSRKKGGDPNDRPTENAKLLSPD